jgi:chorismate mutase
MTPNTARIDRQINKLVAGGPGHYNSGMKKTVDAPSLGELRKEIDQIDEGMHALLMKRGDIIDRLIASKKTNAKQEIGSAFRPAREADMMRRLVKRHKGMLPLDTVESIWRVIISTFTYVQAPFSVHADLTAGDAMMRDSARFHFGFTVPFVPHMGAAGVVAAVSESKGDLGLVPALAVASSGAWWSALEFDTAPKIIARLPFVDRDDHPADLPVFVISRVAPDAMANEASMWSIRVSGWGAKTAQALSALADFIAVPDSAFDGAALLVTVPEGKKLDDLSRALVNAGATVRSSALVGSHATRYTVAADKS